MIRDWQLRRAWQGVAHGLSGLAVAAAFAAIVTCAPALAQAPYPSKPIRLLVGFPPGGPTDIVARVIGAKLSDAFGQQVYVENRSGASGNLALEAAARAENDGHTLHMSLMSTAVNESLFKNFKYGFAEHFEPVAPIGETGLVLLVHPSLDVRSVPDLVAMAKAKPGETLYATAGKGTATHVAAESFSLTAGIKMTPVHYKGGGDTIKDLLSGQVKVMFSTIPPVLGFVRDGRLRGLATSAPKRDPALPDLPTIAESGLPGFDVRLWFGLVAPKGTPRPVIEKLAAATKQALESDDAKTKLAALAFTPLYGTPEEFGAFYRSEIGKWAKVVESIGALGD